MKLNEMVEIINKKYLVEDYSSNEAELEQFIFDTLSNALDNIAMEAASKFSWYNPEWCEEDGFEYFETLKKASKEFTKGLLKNYYI